jgi:hypothetical protein
VAPASRPQLIANSGGGISFRSITRLQMAPPRGPGHAPHFRIGTSGAHFEW